MLIVQHSTGPSKIHGTGVFCNEKVKKTQLVWVYDETVDEEIGIEDLLSMPEPVVNMFMRHACYVKHRQTFVMGLDGDYFMNHSDNPNLFDDGRYMYAARDIEPGDELTCDYRTVIVVAYDPVSGRAHAKDLSDFHRIISTEQADE